MVFLEVGDFAGRLVGSSHHAFEEGLVVLRPLADGELGDEQRGVIRALNAALDDVASLALAALGDDLLTRNKLASRMNSSLTSESVMLTSPVKP